MQKLKNIYNSRTKDFWMLELSYGLHFLGRSVTTIFIPIILLSIGFSLEEVIFYYIILHFFNVIFHYPSKLFLEHYGLKKSLILGTVFAVLFFTSYFFLEYGDWTILILMAVLAAAYDAFYFIAHFYGFMNSTEKIENNAGNTTILNIVASVSNFTGPLLGSAVILFYDNKNILLAITIVFFSLSLIPLLKYKQGAEKIIQKSLSWKEFFSDKKNKKNHITLAFSQVSRAAEAVLWPIFIFMIFKNIDSVAYLAIVIIITSLLFTYFSGNISKKNREKVIIYSSIGLMFVWTGRMFIDHYLYLYASSILTIIFILFIRMPLDGNLFRRGKEISAISASFYRNIISMGTRLVFYILVFITLYFSNLEDFFIVIIFSLLAIVITNILYLKKKYKKTR